MLQQATRLGTRTYVFGAAVVRFESEDEGWLALLEQRYPGFAGTEGAFGFTIRFEPSGPAPTELVSPLEVKLEHVTSRAIPEGFELETPTTRARVDEAGRHAALRGPSAMYPLDNLLRHLLPVLWPKGALFHGAALELELETGRRGVLACGPSGAGKSTLARLVGRAALCDELAGVRQEADGSYGLLSLPFWGARPGAVPLSHLLLLEHGTEHGLDRLSAGEALRAFSQLLLWPTPSAEAMARAFEQLTRLVTTVPALRLTFAPRADVRNFLEKELP